MLRTIIALAAVLTIISCSPNTNNTDTVENKDSLASQVDLSADVNPVNNALSADSLAALKAEYQHIQATFKAFSMGDLGHYIFETKPGESIDFNGVSDPEYELAIWLTDELTTEENQGMAPNEIYLGKQFDVYYDKVFNEDYGIDMLIVRKLIPVTASEKPVFE